MSIEILTALPVFNEASHLASVLDEVRRFSSDILVVDDGSHDETPQLLAQQPDLHVVTHEVNQGYGAALRSSFDFAVRRGYDVLVTIDCDGQHEPRLIPELAETLIDSRQNDWDLVSGSRYLKRFEGDSVPPEARRAINARITQLVNERLGLQLTDAFCGFKAYRVSSLPQLEITETGYAMPLQLWAQAVRNDWAICEFPVPLVYLDEERSFGGSLDDADRRLAYYLEVLEREIGRSPTPCSTLDPDHREL